MKIEWVRSIFRQCRSSGAAFFFKQWGGVQKHRTGRELRGKTYDEMPVPKDRDFPKSELTVASCLGPREVRAAPPPVDQGIAARHFSSCSQTG